MTVTLLSVRVRESRVTGLPLLQRGRVGERVGVAVTLLSVRVERVGLLGYLYSSRVGLERG